MEDMLQFLFIVALIAIGIVKQVRTEAKKKAKQVPQHPLPEAWDAPSSYPHDAADEATHQPASPRTRPAEPAPFLQQPAPKPFIPQPAPQNTSRPQPKVQPPTADVPAQTESNFRPELNNLEDIRKGIIWSEILNRKY